MRYKMNEPCLGTYISKEPPATVLIIDFNRLLYEVAVSKHYSVKPSIVGYFTTFKEMSNSRISRWKNSLSLEFIEYLLDEKE